MDLVHILCFLLLPFRLDAAVAESACAERGDGGFDEILRTGGTSALQMNIAKGLASINASDGTSMLQRSVASSLASVSASDGVEFARTRSHADNKDRQRRSASINSKDYAKVMSEVIHRYKGLPAEENLELQGHKAFECRMPKCRRAGCDDFHPDCCNAKMARMLSDVANFLRKRGHGFAPTFGTLLGALRNQAMIPWTADVDLSLDQDAIDDLLNQEEIPYRFFRPPHDGVVRGCPYYEHGERRYWATGDISSLHQDHEHRVFFYMDLYEDAMWQKPYLKQFPNCIRAADPSAKKEVWIYNLQLPAVIDAEKCLQSAYGRDWRVPKHEDQGDRVALMQVATHEGATHQPLDLNSTTGERRPA